jgi:hypothetical protein
LLSWKPVIPATYTINEMRAGKFPAQQKGAVARPFRISGGREAYWIALSVMAVV